MMDSDRDGDVRGSSDDSGGNRHVQSNDSGLTLAERVALRREELLTQKRQELAKLLEEHDAVVSITSEHRKRVYAY